MNQPGSDFLGTQYPAPTDANYYLNQVGLSSLAPQAFNANTLSAMFSPQGMQDTPVNVQGSNPFENLFLQSSQDALKLQHKQVGQAQPGQNPEMPQGGM